MPILFNFLTPHKISILTLIEISGEIHNHIEHQIYGFIIEEIETSKKDADPKFSAFLLRLQRLPRVSKELVDLMENKLKMIDSLEALNLFFGNFEKVLRTEEIKKSFFGIFIRRCTLAYRKFSFEEEVKFFEVFQSYLLNDQKFYYSIQQAEYYLDVQVSLLQTASGIAPSTCIQDNLNEMLKILPSMAKAHYLSYLNCLRSGELRGATENLHRFFDHYGFHQNKRLFQYAGLNLASLHARFHHFEETVTVLQEVVRTARNNSDPECLSYALTWLDRLTDETTHYATQE